MTTKTHEGSCHCGKVRFEADLDLAAGTGRCNCTYCSKTRGWNINLKPAAFRLKQGEGELTEYKGYNRNYFCRTCGTTLFTKGHIKEIGGDFVTVRISALNGLTAEELAGIPLRYSDGLNNNWMNPPKVHRYL